MKQKYLPELQNKTLPHSNYIPAQVYALHT